MSSPKILVVSFKQLESLQLDPEIVGEILKSREIIVDAENAMLGRLASLITKIVKLGFKVHVVNIEKAVISGDKKSIVDSYKLLLKVKTHKNPYKHSIHRPRHPINIFKKTLKNMMPRHSSSRFKLSSKVKAYLGIPPELRNKNKYIIKILDCDASYLGRKKVVPVSVIAKELGWRGETEL